MQVNIHEAKTQLSKLLEALESGVEKEIIIARAGKPVAKLSPIAPAKAKRTLGTLAGQGWEAPDAWEPDEELIDLAMNGPIFPEDEANAPNPTLLAEDPGEYDPDSNR